VLLRARRGWLLRRVPRRRRFKRRCCTAVLDGPRGSSAICDRAGAWCQAQACSAFSACRITSLRMNFNFNNFCNNVRLSICCCTSPARQTPARTPDASHPPPLPPSVQPAHSRMAESGYWDEHAERLDGQTSSHSDLEETSRPSGRKA